jgi:hypothetical protein
VPFELALSKRELLFFIKVKNEFISRILKLGLRAVTEPKSVEI